MGHPNAHHGTTQEIKFMRGLSAHGRLTRLQMLRNYRAAAERRTEWGSVDAGELLHATDREIAAEAKRVNRK